MPGTDTLRAGLLGRLKGKIQRLLRAPELLAEGAQLQRQALDDIRLLLTEQNALLAKSHDQMLAMMREAQSAQASSEATSRDLIWKVTEIAKEATWRAYKNAASARDVTGSTAQVYSQTAEDSMIADIFARIGVGSRFFVEFGVEDGTENTTRWLLEQGWRGIWVEGSEAQVARASAIFAEPIAAGRLTIVNAMAEPTNANTLLSNAGVPETVDYLSVDVDHNTSHVWEALHLKARVSCIEYNAAIPPSIDVSAAYRAGHGWDGTNWFGAGLKSLERIGRSKGLALIGCDFAGVNGYFVEEDTAADHFAAPFTAEDKYQPPRYHLVGKSGHPPAANWRHWQTGPSSLTV